MDAGGRAAYGTSGRGGRAMSGTKADAYRDVGGRAVSGTKAEESSGLYNSFPPGGNDHLWVIPARRHPRKPLDIPACLPGFRPAPE